MDTSNLTEALRNLNEAYDMLNKRDTMSAQYYKATQNISVAKGLIQAQLTIEESRTDG